MKAHRETAVFYLVSYIFILEASQPESESFILASPMNPMEHWLT